jgi:hypothetical protein
MDFSFFYRDKVTTPEWVNYFGSSKHFIFTSFGKTFWTADSALNADLSCLPCMQSNRQGNN